MNNMSMRKTFFVCGIATMALTFGSCSDYFEVDTNDILLDKDYVKESNELYSGYMGVASKMQAIADQTVFLSDLRTDLLEPTVNADRKSTRLNSSHVKISYAVF